MPTEIEKILQVLVRHLSTVVSATVLSFTWHNNLRKSATAILAVIAGKKRPERTADTIAAHLL